ncbi:MAG: response regulator transcription factor [Bacillota bacterium]|nr:response regulator transcription factor [Bacillota bacterium]
MSSNSGTEALSYLKDNKLTAIMLDLSLPDMNGLEILKYVRSNPIYNSIVVIVVSSNDDKLDTIIALEMGADDYITKPFHQRELVARLNSVLRRINSSVNESDSLIIFDYLEIDIDKRIVKKDGFIINLSFKEFEILTLLASNPGKVITRDVILNKIGGPNYTPETRTVDVHISSIRRKLGYTDKSSGLIDTVSGVGYRFRE